MAKGKIENTFFNDGFKITYYDGSKERFHKSFFDETYKGDKGSKIQENWLDDGFTILKYDGTKERFEFRDGKEFIVGDKGTRVRISFWGDSLVTENPYADFKPITLTDARKAKYAETQIRVYELDRNENATVENLQREIQEIIEAASLKVVAYEVDYNGVQAIAIASTENSSYMPLINYFMAEDGAFGLVSSVIGKGVQINSSDLSKMLYKAASPWGKVQLKITSGDFYSKHLGYSFRTGGAAGGVVALAGFAVGSSARLMVKGLKALMRDNESYKLEMDFYNLAAGIIDYSVGLKDSYGIVPLINDNADKGVPIAQYRMGLACTYGTGVEADSAKGFEWFEKAAERGELQSQNIVAGEYLSDNESRFSIEQKKQAVSYLYNIASFGENWAFSLLIDILGRGIVPEIPVDFDEAIRIAEIASGEGNVYAAEFLAPIYDSQFETCDELAAYKNDVAAFQKYKIVADYGSGNSSSEAAYKVACMAEEGRGVEYDSSISLMYFEKSASSGNINAKMKLLENYTLDNSKEAPKRIVKKLVKELKETKDPVIVSKVTYCMFMNAVRNKRFGDSLKLAKEYLNGDYKDKDKAEEIEVLVKDIESRISNMTDEERRVFLNERKTLSDYINLAELKQMLNVNKKKVLIVLALIIVIVIGIIIFFSMNGDYSNDEQMAENNFTERIQPASKSPKLDSLREYDKMLSQNSFERDNTNDDASDIWYSDNCSFDTAYLNDDDVPELLVVDKSDSEYESEYGQIYTYNGNDVVPMCSLCEVDDDYGINLGYYKDSGYYMDFVMDEGFGTVYILNAFNYDSKEFIQVYDFAENGDAYLISCSVDDEEVDEETFNQKLMEATNNAEFIPYSFKLNDKSARDKWLCDSNDDIYGEAFDHIGRTYGDLESEYGTLEFYDSHDGSIKFISADGRIFGFPLYDEFEESGEMPEDAECTVYVAEADHLNDAFQLGDYYSIEELAAALGKSDEVGELEYDPTGWYNATVWEIEKGGVDYRIIVRYDEDYEIENITICLPY